MTSIFRTIVTTVAGKGLDRPAYEVISKGKMTSIFRTIVTSVGGKGLDRPAYEVISKGKDYEERRYAPAKWVTTVHKSMKQDDAASVGFRKLFNFIQGENEKEMKIEMTAPVTTRVEPGAGPNCESTFHISFYIPPEHQESPPAPKNADVFIEDRPEMTVYVRSFGGFAKGDSWVQEAQKLTESIQDKTNQIHQDFWYTAGYNSPYQLFGRTNDIWLVKK